MSGPASVSRNKKKSQTLLATFNWQRAILRIPKSFQVFHFEKLQAGATAERDCWSILALELTLCPVTAGIWECAFFQIFSRETSSRASDLYGKRLHEMDQEERSQQVGPFATPFWKLRPPRFFCGDRQSIAQKPLREKL